jgi:hypothetical protein
MLEVHAVVVADYVEPFRHWPVDRYQGSTSLSGRLSPAEVGSAMAAIVKHCDTDESAPDAAALLRSLVRSEKVIAWGGLRVRDTDTGITVAPGCCCGLEDWRDWLQLVRRERPWLGHDPEPKIVFGDGVAWLWPTGGFDDAVPSGPAVVIRLDELPARLEVVRQELMDFLALVRRQFGAEVAEVLDDQFTIGAPLAA